MKEKKRPHGTKAEIRAHKKRLRFISAAITVAILALLIVFSIFVIYSYLNSQSSNQPPIPPPASELKAAIVDQLSLTVPNQTFIETATKILETGNYTVDYYPGEEVTVGFYRNLPTNGYRLIILRAHSSATSLQGEEFVRSPVVFFTSEPYSQTKYVVEQLTDQLGKASYAPPEPPYYFSIHHEFVTSSMNGKFQNTTIVMMGCEGLRNTAEKDAIMMAEALIKKGAKVYIGWSGDVSATHTDRATVQLLDHLITEKQKIEQAITETLKEVGPDPVDGSELKYYPDTSVDSYVITNIATNLILKDATITGKNSSHSSIMMRTRIRLLPGIGIRRTKARK